MDICRYDSGQMDGPQMLLATQPYMVDSSCIKKWEEPKFQGEISFLYVWMLINMNWNFPD